MSTPTISPTTPSRPTRVAAKQLHSRLGEGETLQLVDVRSAREYAEGHIPGAMNIPMEQAEARLDDLGARDTVVLICQSGRRAGMTCTQLKGRRDDLTVLEGGTQAWIDAGLPVVRSVATRLPLMRQVQIGAGSLILTGALLAIFVHPGFVALPIFVGAGLLVAGTTGFCGMAILLEKMPWNRAKR